MNIVSVSKTEACFVVFFPDRVSKTLSTLYNVLYFIRRRLTVNAGDSSTYGLSTVM